MLLPAAVAVIFNFDWSWPVWVQRSRQTAARGNTPNSGPFNIPLLLPNDIIARMSQEWFQLCDGLPLVLDHLHSTMSRLIEADLIPEVKFVKPFATSDMCSSTALSFSSRVLRSMIVFVCLTPLAQERRPAAPSLTRSTEGSPERRQEKI